MADRYPYEAGHRGIDTSVAAANLINDKLPQLQRAVLGAIVAAGERGMTGDEVAAVLGWDRHRVRPRTSELRHMRRIGDSGHRRPSDFGVQSIVWVAAEHLDRGGLEG